MDVGVVNLRDDVRDCLADAGEFVGRSSAMIWGLDQGRGAVSRRA